MRTRLPQPDPRHPAPGTRHLVRRGFSLMEVMVALGIFTLGFVTVAAIFPAGALMQKRATERILSEHVAKNTQSLIQGRSLSYRADANPANTSGDLGVDGDRDGADADYPVIAGWNGYYAASQNIDGGDDNVVTLDDVSGTAPDADQLLTRWSIYDRSYPSTNPDALSRSFYWLPLIQDVNGDPESPTWVMYIFILQHDEGNLYGRQELDHYGWFRSDGNSNLRSNVPVLVAAPAQYDSFDTFRMTSIPSAFADADAAVEALAPGTRLLLSDGTLTTVKKAERSGGDVDVQVFGFVSPNFNNGRVYLAPPAQGSDTSPVMDIIVAEIDVNDVP